MKYLISLLIFCNFTFVAFSDCIDGSGNIIEDKIYLPDINSIIVEVPMNLVLTPSQDESILVKSNIDVMKNLKFEYDDKELTIKSRQDLCPKELTVFISLKTIKEIELKAKTKLTSTSKFEVEDFNLEISGSADVDFSVDADEVTISLSGAGSINLAGKSNEMDINLDGSGNIDASKFISEDIETELDGSGIIQVNPTKSLKANLSGNGKILYKNKPEKLETQIDGNGIIDKIK